MGFGLVAIDFAISSGVLCSLLAANSSAQLRLGRLTSADAGTGEVFRLLPFSELPEEIDDYLMHYELFLVRPGNVDRAVLLWIHKFPEITHGLRLPEAPPLKQALCRKHGISQTSQEKVNSRPVVPTIFLFEPFGDNVEGLAHCVDKIYDLEIVYQFWQAIVCLPLETLTKLFFLFENQRFKSRCHFTDMDPIVTSLVRLRVKRTPLSRPENIFS